MERMMLGMALETAAAAAKMYEIKPKGTERR